MTAILVLLVLEGLARLAVAASPALRSRLERPRTVTALPDAELGGRPNPALPDNDRHGYRNPPGPGTYDVVTLGDSQTYGISVAREDAWPGVLERLSGHAVYNMAWAGWAPRQHLALVDEVRTRAPKLVLVGVFSGNDFVDTYLDFYVGGRDPSLRTPSPKAREEIAAYDRDPRNPRLGDAFSETMRLARHSAGAEGPDGVADAFGTRVNEARVVPFEERVSMLARIVGAVVGRRERFRRVAGREVDVQAVRRAADAADDRLLFALEHAGLQTVLVPEGRRVTVNGDDPRVREGVRISVELLRRLRDRLRPDTETVVVFLPTKELVLDEWARSSGERLPVELVAAVRGEERLWAIMRDGLAAARIAWVDTLPALRSLVGRGENPYWPDWDSHFSEAGNRAVAEAVAGDPGVRQILGARR